MKFDRKEHLQKLQTEVFDVLVIGGGATGAGTALDAQLRGLRVALVEKKDFASGTSSRSTKLVHGGVRYLEKAFLHLDRSQFRLVREALKERKCLTEIAPHLVTWLPLLIPMYRRFQTSYYHAGLRVYDWLAGKHLIHRSRLVSKEEAIDLCPFLKRPGLRGGVIYYDGQFDDSRMAMSILLTAIQKGATISNYVEVTGFLKKDGLIKGAHVFDSVSKQTFTIQAKTVVNATGPFTDEIRKLDSSENRPVLQVSSGVHLVVPLSSPAPQVGVLIPKTQDKRVLFVLPWKKHLLIGTTDEPSQVDFQPHPTSKEIDFILKEYRTYFEKPLETNQIFSAWSGLRPLVNEDPQAKTASLSRDHSFEETPSGLLSIFGGKWTTYRIMAQDTVDRLQNKLNNHLKSCTTHQEPLIGAQQLSLQSLHESLAQTPYSPATRQHLLETYGDCWREIQAKDSKNEELIHPSFPYLMAEIPYLTKAEGVQRTSDLLFRRLRMGFLDETAAQESYERVSREIGQLLDWTSQDHEEDKSDFESHFSLLH